MVGFVVLPFVLRRALLWPPGSGLKDISAVRQILIPGFLWFSQTVALHCPFSVAPCHMPTGAMAVTWSWCVGDDKRSPLMSWRNARQLLHLTFPFQPRSRWIFSTSSNDSSWTCPHEGASDGRRLFDTRRETRSSIQIKRPHGARRESKLCWWGFVHQRSRR